MADIVNITRTYTFANGIPLVNSQLESEIQNIVDTFNKDIAVITGNVDIFDFAVEPGIGIGTQLSASNTYLLLCSISLGIGEWQVSGMAGLQDTSGSISSLFQAGITSDTSTVLPNFNGYIAGQKDVGVFVYPARTYISIPPFNYNVSSGGNSLASVTLYLKVAATFTGSPNPYVFGSIRARRMSR